MFSIYRKILSDLSADSPTKIESIPEDGQLQSADGSESSSITTSTISYQQQQSQTVTIPQTIQIAQAGETVQLQAMPMAAQSGSTVVQYQQQQVILYRGLRINSNNI